MPGPFPAWSRVLSGRRNDAVLKGAPVGALRAAVDVPSIEDGHQIELGGHQEKLASIAIPCEHLRLASLVIRYPPLISVAGVGAPVVRPDVVHSRRNGGSDPFLGHHTGVIPHSASQKEIPDPSQIVGGQVETSLCVHFPIRCRLPEVFVNAEGTEEPLLCPQVHPLPTLPSSTLAPLL